MDGMYEVKVSKHLEDLVPVFLTNRIKDVDLLRAAVVAMDFAVLSQVGHRLKGVGSSYGFAQISSVGRLIEAAAKEGDAASLAQMIEDFDTYLRRLRVTYE